MICRVLLGACVYFTLLSGLPAWAQVLPEDPEPPPVQLREPVERVQQITASPTRSGLELSWSDTFSRLDGKVTPNPPAAGAPFFLLLKVGNFDGPDFSGDLTLHLRNDRGFIVDQRELKRQPGGWQTHLTAPAEGNYTLEVVFRSDHIKHLYAPIAVGAAGVPPWIFWTLVALAALAAVGFGARSLFQKAPAPRP